MNEMISNSQPPSSISPYFSVLNSPFSSSCSPHNFYHYYPWLLTYGAAEVFPPPSPPSRGTVVRPPDLDRDNGIRAGLPLAPNSPAALPSPARSVGQIQAAVDQLAVEMKLMIERERQAQIQFEKREADRARYWDEMKSLFWGMHHRSTCGGISQVAATPRPVEVSIDTPPTRCSMECPREYPLPLNPLYRTIPSHLPLLDTNPQILNFSSCWSQTKPSTSLASMVPTPSQSTAAVITTIPTVAAPPTMPYTSIAIRPASTRQVLDKSLQPLPLLIRKLLDKTPQSLSRTPVSNVNTISNVNDGNTTTSSPPVAPSFDAITPSIAASSTATTTTSTSIGSLAELCAQNTCKLFDEIPVGNVEMRVTPAIVSEMPERKHGAIANIGSGTAMVVPSNPHYAVNAATKAPQQACNCLSKLDYPHLTHQVFDQMPVEFYSSYSNLPRDKFLGMTVQENKDGLVSSALICSFDRIITHLGLDGVKQDEVSEETMMAVAETLRKSSFLKVSEEGKKIGRSTERPKPEEICGLSPLLNFTYSHNFITGNPPACLGLPTFNDRKSCLPNRKVQRSTKQCRSFLSLANCTASLQELNLGLNFLSATRDLENLMNMMDELLYPIAIVIDEMKNEEVQLRLSSIIRHSTIARALGKERTRRKLIPFLNGNNDNADEVLLALDEELGVFISHVGKVDCAYVLLSPLEMLCSVEETCAMDKTVESVGTETTSLDLLDLCAKCYRMDGAVSVFKRDLEDLFAQETLENTDDIFSSYNNRGGYNLLGYSKRRGLLGESNEFVGYKVVYALSQGLKIIACVGGILEQREIDSTKDVVITQTQAIPFSLITRCSESKQSEDLWRIQDSFMKWLVCSTIEIDHELIEMFFKCNGVGNTHIVLDRIVGFVTQGNISELIAAARSYGMNHKGSLIAVFDRGKGSPCYGFSNMDNFSIKGLLGILLELESEFVSCNQITCRALLSDWMGNFEVGILALLEDDIRMLIVKAGDSLDLKIGMCLDAALYTALTCALHSSVSKEYVLKRQLMVNVSISSRDNYTPEVALCCLAVNSDGLGVDEAKDEDPLATVISAGDSPLLSAHSLDYDKSCLTNDANAERVLSQPRGLG